MNGALFGMPRIPDQYLDCVFYLYHSEEDAKAGRNAGGTGFFVSLETKADPTKFFIFAVTNWHVACQAGASVVRVMRKDGTPDIFAFGPEDWLFDPKGHDVAIHPTIPVQSDTHNIAYVPVDASIKLNEAASPIGVGDDVFMIGRFVDHDGGEINRPTVRFGNISLMPTPISLPNSNKLDTYCLDMHSRSGYSGSPVFVFRTPGGDLSVLKDGKENHVLLGGSRVLLPLGIHIGQFPEIWKIKGVKTAAIPAESVELTASEQHIEGVSGMTCVAPLSAIQALLEIPQVKKLIEDGEARLAKEATPPAILAPQSATPAPTPTEGDEQHKERFTALLDAAVGKPK